MIERRAANALRRVYYPLAILIVVLFLGTAFYRFVEGWPFIDAVYMTVITITTVGFREVEPLDTTGKLATILIIVFGVGTLFYLAGTLLESAIEGHFLDALEMRRMKGRITKMKDHYILCGFGRVGREVAKELAAKGADFVVVDRSPEVLAECPYSYVEGDSVHDEVLVNAGIMEAKGLIAALGDDADNVFVVLSARTLRPDITIVARASDERSENKLKKAGADRVISPHAIGGKRMASMLVRPAVCDYLDIVTEGDDMRFELDRFEVKAGSTLDGQTIKTARVRETTGAMILAIRKTDGTLDQAPGSAARLDAGDSIIAIGTREQIGRLERLSTPA